MKSSTEISIENLHSHFKDLLGQIPENTENNEQTLEGQTNNELDLAITEQEIRKAVFKQKNGKSSGPDDISSELIKSAYDVIAPYILSLFNDLYDKSEYPESWGLGYIVPIYKGGDPKNAKKLSWNYLK